MNYWKEATRHYFFETPKHIWNFLIDAKWYLVEAIKNITAFILSIFWALLGVVVWCLPFIAIPILVDVIKTKERINDAYKKARLQRKRELLKKLGVPDEEIE